MLEPTQTLSPEVVGAVVIAVIAMTQLSQSMEMNGQSIEKALMLVSSAVFFSLMAFMMYPFM